MQCYSLCCKVGQFVEAPEQMTALLVKSSNHSKLFNSVYFVCRAMISNNVLLCALYDMI